MGTGPHGAYCGLVRDVARDDDEGQVQPKLLHQGKRCQAVEARHEVVGNHQVPLLAIERGAHLLPSLHLVALRGVAGPLQLDFEQGAVVLGVLDDQHPEWPVHGW